MNPSVGTHTGSRLDPLSIWTRLSLKLLFRYFTVCSPMDSTFMERDAFLWTREVRVTYPWKKTPTPTFFIILFHTLCNVVSINDLCKYLSPTSGWNHHGTFASFKIVEQLSFFHHFLLHWGNVYIDYGILTYYSFLLKVQILPPGVMLITHYKPCQRLPSNDITSQIRTCNG